MDKTANDFLEFTREMEPPRPVPDFFNYFIPMVVEKTGHGERVSDIFSRLLKERIVFMGWPLDDMAANVVIAQMLFLQFENKNQDVRFYINSSGGNITSGLAVYDTMQLIQCPVSTTVVGRAFSMAAVLLAAGAKGKRYGLPHSRIMIHQPWGGLQGTALDIGIHAEELVLMKKWINELLVKHTGQPTERIEEDADRYFYMSSKSAKEYGLIDDILTGPEK